MTQPSYEVSDAFKMRVDMLEGGLEIAQEIQNMTDELFSLADDVATAKENLAYNEALTYAIVCQQVNDAGKSLFSNDAGRKAESDRRLLQDEAYVSLKRTVREAEALVAKKQAAIQCRRDCLSLTKAFLTGGS